VEKIFLKRFFSKQKQNTKSSKTYFFAPNLYETTLRSSFHGYGSLKIIVLLDKHFLIKILNNYDWA
jgi:hypothetical protein